MERALGRIEGRQEDSIEAQKKLFELVETLHQDFQDHKSDDRHAFQLLSSQIGLLKEQVNKGDEEQIKINDSRSASLKKMSEDLGVINGYVDNIKGAWWMIGIVVVIIGGFGALIAWTVQIWQSRH